MLFYSSFLLLSFYLTQLVSFLLNMEFSSNLKHNSQKPKLVRQKNHPDTVGIKSETLFHFITFDGIVMLRLGSMKIASLPGEQDNNNLH